ncbi:MAG TPA: hypothetical protein VN043_12935 [Rhodanobacter sp.]|nr:hypothetical protein [Rhodanobacter sp.]
MTCSLKWMDAACYADRPRASHRRQLPAFRHKPAANRPHRAAPGADIGALMKAVNNAAEIGMNLDHDTRDPNAELRGFEPLRISLALGALLLGLLLGIH